MENRKPKLRKLHMNPDPFQAAIDRERVIGNDGPDDVLFIYKHGGKKGYLKNIGIANTNMKLIQSAIGAIDAADLDGIYLVSWFSTDNRIDIKFYCDLADLSAVDQFDEDDEPCKGKPKASFIVLKDVAGRSGIRTEFTRYGDDITSRLKRLIGQAILLDDDFSRNATFGVKLYYSPGGSFGIDTEVLSVGRIDRFDIVMQDFEFRPDYDCFEDCFYNVSSQVHDLIRSVPVCPVHHPLELEDASDLRYILEQIRFIGDTIAVRDILDDDAYDDDD